jgi:hypothetical protein
LHVRFPFDFARISILAGMRQRPVSILHCLSSARP